jgi:uncharacterized protein YcbX
VTGAAGGAVGEVADLWRFPVKSFAGERVRRGWLGAFGLVGDRRHAVLLGGAPLSARRAPALLGFRAALPDADGAEVEVETPEGARLAWDDPRLAERVSRAAGRPVALARAASSFVDAAPLHIATLDALAALGRTLGADVDRRRFRANLWLAVDGAESVALAQPGRRLAIGERVVVEVAVPTERCAVTTVDPDDLGRHPGVLRTIARDWDACFGVYAVVLTEGPVAVGDPVRAGPAAAA